MKPLLLGEPVTDYVLVRPPAAATDEIGWLADHGTITRLIGYGRYWTVTHFDRVTWTGITRHGTAMTAFNTDAGEFMATRHLRARFTDDLRGAHIYFEWWRGQRGHLVSSDPLVRAEARHDTRRPGQTWAHHDYEQRLDTDPANAGVLRRYDADAWWSLPERVRFGCLR